jgi:plastocyanin
VIAAALLATALLGSGAVAAGKSASPGADAGISASTGAEAAGKRARVKLGDNFYRPTKKTISKGTKVSFKWTGSNRHDVTLKKGPGKKFASRTTRKKGVNFTRRFKKPGTYRIFCTIHPDQMHLRLKVK